MVQRSLLARILSMCVCVSVCCPAVAIEATSTSLKSDAVHKAIDLRLGDGGVLMGKVVDPQGKPLSNLEVKLTDKRGTSAAVTTNANGMFGVRGLRVGELTLGVDGRARTVRAWSAETAPPNAAEVALVVVGDTVRAQCGPSCGGCVSCQPLIPAQPCGSACGGCNMCADRGIFGGGLHGWSSGFATHVLSHPWLIGAGVAAAIAIPLAVDDNDAS